MMIAVCVLALGCGADVDLKGTEPDRPETSLTASEQVVSEVIPAFVDRAVESGLDSVHFNGMSGELYLSEITCGGGALADLDGDGDLDVYVSQGHMLGQGKTVTDALLPPYHSGVSKDRLFRNDTSATSGESRGLRFTDVTDAMGLEATEYGCAVAAGDIDNDGHVDLFLANLGPDQLLRNRGVEGSITFDDVTAEAGVAGGGQSSGGHSTVALFFDYDRDGWLDLYVGSYVRFDTTGATRCASLSGAADYCGPGAYDAEPDHLYRNLGGGTFEDVSVAVGLRSVPPHPALGAVAADFDGDGWPDLYVANDGEPNQLWLNLRDGQGNVIFEDRGLLSGSAVNGAGASEAGMGTDAADYDGDGDMDIVVAHLIKETHTLYQNDGNAVFRDGTDGSGLGSSSLPYTSFGIGWLDFDNDGWLDLMVANGGVVLDPALVAAKDPFPLHMKNQLLQNLSGVTFGDVSPAAGDAFQLSEVSRGLAAGDVDNDGDADAIVFNNGGRLRLLVNQTGQDRPWIGLRLVEGPRDALGAKAAVLRGGRATAWRLAKTGGSYNVAGDPRVLFGLGDQPEIDGVRVVWPDGKAEEWTDLGTGRYHTLYRGEGLAVEMAP